MLDPGEHGDPWEHDPPILFRLVWLELISCFESISPRTAARVSHETLDQMVWT